MEGIDWPTVISKKGAVGHVVRYMLGHEICPWVFGRFKQGLSSGR
jgi:hypothetical protein